MPTVPTAKAAVGRRKAGHVRAADGAVIGAVRPWPEVARVWNERLRPAEGRERKVISYQQCQHIHQMALAKLRAALEAELADLWSAPRAAAGRRDN